MKIEVDLHSTAVADVIRQFLTGIEDDDYDD